MATPGSRATAAAPASTPVTSARVRADFTVRSPFRPTADDPDAIGRIQAICRKWDSWEK
ncbi:hypothetical protein Afe04nite_44450 [Asanoa ferruginea]|nr:hypothetical protein Afe04nite_44450 [Asanoa ferruginea]